MHVTIEGTLQIPPAAMQTIRESSQSRRRADLEELFLAHRERVFRVAYRITGSAGDAEDVLQTVFLRLARQEQPAEIENPGSYLHRSAINAALDLVRSRKETIDISPDEEHKLPLSVFTSPEQESAELRDWLRKALAKLNPRWAEMFVLRFIEEHDNRQIARMMNTSAAVVAVILHRTRTQLKKDFLACAKRRA